MHREVRLYSHTFSPKPSSKLVSQAAIVPIVFAKYGFNRRADDKQTFHSLLTNPSDTGECKFVGAISKVKTNTALAGVGKLANLASSPAQKVAPKTPDVARYLNGSS